MTEMVWTKQVQQNGLIVWRCEHGLAHPDLESAKLLGIDTSHHCDGCCQRADFPGRKPVTKSTLLEKARGEVDRFLNPLKYETDIERNERHRKENMEHELKLEEVRRTKFIKTSANGKGGSDTKVVVNDAMSSEFGWMNQGSGNRNDNRPRERSFLENELGLGTGPTDLPRKRRTSKPKTKYKRNR